MRKFFSFTAKTVLLLCLVFSQNGHVSAAASLNGREILQLGTHRWNYSILRLRGGAAAAAAAAQFHLGNTHTPPSSSAFWKTRTTAPKSSNSPLYTVQHPEEEEEDFDHEHVPHSTTKEQLQAFLTRDDRNTFIARVYTILSTQLLFTAAIVLAFGSNRNLQHWIFKRGQAVPLLSVVLSSIAWFITCYNPTARRAPKIKWWLLGIFTLGYVDRFKLFNC